MWSIIPFWGVTNLIPDTMLNNVNTVNTHIWQLRHVKSVKSPAFLSTNSVFAFLVQVDPGHSRFL